jgi:hypothetical protein
MNAESLRFKDGTCSCKILLFFRIHVRLRSYQGFNDSKMPVLRCIMQRNEPTTDIQRRMRGDLAHEHEDEMRFKGGTCGCKALLLLRIQVRLGGNQGLSDLQMPIHACMMQRYEPVSDE